MTIEEKKREYTKRFYQLREDKVQETQKKLKRYGYSDEDDYHYLVPPEDYTWKPTADSENGDFHGYRSWADNYESMIDSFPPVVVPYSSMCGNYFRILQKFRNVPWNEADDFSHLKPAIEKYNIVHGIGSVHHFCGDIRIGLSLGWPGLLEKVQYYANLNTKDQETKDFYYAEEKLVKTVIRWIKRTSDEIERKMDIETDLLLKENLREMLETNRAIETGAPTNLRQVCQFMSWYNIAGRCYNREGCGGQLDQLLYPYYINDIQNGIIDDEDAIYYIGGLLLSDTKYYQLGGPTADGKDMTNQVSWLILEAADRLNITANLTVRVHEGLDEKFFRRSVELLFKHKNAWPRFSGDKSLVEGFMSNGFSRELACSRIAVGCNWMAIPGIEYGICDCIKLNLAKIFEVAFYEVVQEDTPSVEKLWQLYCKHLKIALNATFSAIDFHLRTNRYNSPELFLNLFCKGPIEKGRDASDHSLEYYNISIDGAGIAVAADSFAALEQRVEKEKRINWLELTNGVRTNYSSPASKRVQAFMKTAEKFGQGDNLGLKWAKKISEIFADIVVSGHSAEGARFIPGLFSWSQTIKFGQAVGATPDGRKAGEAINHGANPMPGSVKSGEMTTMSESIAAIQCRKGNTAPFQMELDPCLSESEGGIEKVMALLRTHLEQGGTLINVNIMDTDKILKAHEDPSLYPDLVVRVTGFTAYFASLSPEFRKLVVDRIMAAN